MQALRDAVSGTGEDGAAALNEATASAERLGEAVTKAGGAAGGARDALEHMKDVAKGLAEDITGPLKDALKSGELSWQSFANAVSDIASRLASRLIDTAFKPIEDALLRAFSGGGASGGGSGVFGWITKAIGGLFGGGFAQGGVFAQTGQVAAFARGGIVDRPTVFPFGRGIGLMGEAGPEAILPLRRGPGGRLGVEAGTAQPAAQIAPRIINVLNPGLVGDYLATPAGERAIVNVIRRNRGAFDG
jgi:phage-related minor tail protein